MSAPTTPPLTAAVASGSQSGPASTSSGLSPDYRQDLEESIKKLREQSMDLERRFGGTPRVPQPGSSRGGGPDPSVNSRPGSGARTPQDGFEANRMGQPYQDYWNPPQPTSADPRGSKGGGYCGAGG